MGRSRMPIRWALGLLLLSGFGCHATSVGVRIGDSHPPHHGSGSPTAAARKGPPPWAPAHGHRAKHAYRYYPAAAVYHDQQRGIWFYYEDGEWRAGANLPVQVQVTVGEYVTLEMDTDAPYTHHDAVAQEYPPGQGKTKKKNGCKKTKRG